jgi:rubrerythrin
MTYYETHDSTIRTDEICSPGNMWFRCDAWGLPDNTPGQIGWHGVYRVLDDGHRGHEHVTDAMRTAAREHYAEQERIEAEHEVRREKAQEAADEAALAREAAEIKSGRPQPCPKCGTYCLGDCEL